MTLSCFAYPAIHAFVAPAKISVSFIWAGFSHGSIPRFFLKGYKETAFSKITEISGNLCHFITEHTYFTTIVTHSDGLRYCRARFLNFPGVIC